LNSASNQITSPSTSTAVNQQQPPTGKLKSFKTVAHILTTFLKKFSKETPSVAVEADLICQQKNRKNECIICSNCTSLNNNNNNNDNVNQKNEIISDVNTQNIKQNDELNNEFVNSVLIPSNNNFNRKTPLMKRISSDDSQHNNPNLINENLNANEQQNHPNQSAEITTGSSVKSNSSNQINSQNLNQPFQYLSINLVFFNSLFF
jgi:hypothetical protein